MPRISPRERTAILQSLVAGVVPGIGLHHLQVGRKEEVEALLGDLKLVEDGAATVRLIVGRYGSGKTFFLNLIRAVALQRKFVVLQADITTERRLYGSGGEARSLYSELMRNLATLARPEGGALSNLVQRWVGDIEFEITSAGGAPEDVRQAIAQRLRPLQDLVSGYDFAQVLSRYYDGFQSHNEDLQAQAMRWLRGEFTTKTEAREALGVRSIITDAVYYDYLKLLAAFVRLAGYRGLLVNIDELVVISHRLSNTQARNKNYESILRIINDCLQGRAQGLAFVFAGTDECVEDRRRGLFSYEALATRLAPSRFVSEDRRDWSSPVIKLQSLTPEDCFVLLSNIRRVHAGGDDQPMRLPDEGVVTYLRDCSERMGAAYFQTPRDTVRDFVSLLNLLEQDAQLDWNDLLQSRAFAMSPAEKPSASEVDGEDGLEEFTL